LAGLLSSNSSVQLQFEQLFAYFPKNFVFIAEKKYKSDIEFYFRYCFDEIEESDIVVDLEEYEEVVAEASEVKEISFRVFNKIGEHKVLSLFLM
jgi:hypothetical protein